jgi:GNAT superfamily N-acetyltransferase
MLITPASPNDLGILLGFRDEASRWLKARGIDQWSEPWPTEDLMAEGMLRSIQAGEVFIVWSDAGEPMATLTVDHWANPDLWTESEQAEPAVYVHKVTVARAHAGQNLGAMLLDWAGTRAAEEDARWLRLDAWTTNKRLHRYYLDQGFTHVRSVVLKHNPSGALFQRSAREQPTLGLHFARRPAHEKTAGKPLGDAAANSRAYR